MTCCKKCKSRLFRCIPIGRWGKIKWLYVCDDYGEMWEE